MLCQGYCWTLKKLNQFKPVMSIAQLVSIPEFPLFGGRFRPIMSRPNALDFSLISRWRRYREYIRTVMTSHSLNVCPLLLFLICTAIQEVGDWGCWLVNTHSLSVCAKWRERKLRQANVTYSNPNSQWVPHQWDQIECWIIWVYMFECDLIWVCMCIYEYDHWSVIGFI